MTDHQVVGREEWTARREDLLAREKEHTRMGDELARQRRELPWVRVEKEYRFDTDDGSRALADLFEGRSQLLVYHFMFGPSYQAGCPTCSSMADTIDGALPHLHARDVTMTYVSQAPLEMLKAYKRRMGWNMPWVSAAETDFNFDLGYSRTDEQTREAFASMLEAGVPPGIEHGASSSGTDATGYLTQGPGRVRTRRRRRVPDVRDHGPRPRVPDGLLRDPRPRAEGSGRGRRLPVLDPPARRVLS
jgi:predicted dithiol-disulfide oxidoreductase (DUF899 family)